MAKKQNPTAPGKASMGSEIAYLAGSDLDLTTASVAINRLRARYGFSGSVALLIVGLAGIGPREVRS